MKRRKHIIALSAATVLAALAWLVPVALDLPDAMRGQALAAPAVVETGAECGSKDNLVLLLKPLAASSNLPRQAFVNNMNYIILCTGADYAAGASSGNIARISNFGHPTLSVEQLTADITQSGVSGPGRMGGLDVGAPEPNKDYCLWLVSDGATTAQTGVVWSGNCDGRGPDHSVLAQKPYYAYMAWNRTNGSCPGPACAFLYSYMKSDNWVYFAGGRVHGTSGPLGELPTAAKGAKPKWTPVALKPGLVSPHAGAVLWSVENAAAGTHAAVANDSTAQSKAACDNTGRGTITCETPAAAGAAFGYWSTSAGATLRIAGFREGDRPPLPAPGPTITVSLPPAAQGHAAGGTLSVSWTSAHAPQDATVSLRLYTAAGKPVGAVGSALAARGSHDAPLAKSLAAGSYRIHAALISASGKTLAEARSANFTVTSAATEGTAPAASLTLASPKQGESVYKGGSLTIGWSSDNPIGQVRLDLVTGETETFELTLATRPARAGTLEWTVPTAKVPAGRHKIIATMMDGSTVRAVAKSGVFSILNPNGEAGERSADPEPAPAEPPARGGIFQRLLDKIK